MEVNRDAYLKPYRCQLHVSLRLGFITLSMRPHEGKARSLFWASSEALCRCFHLRCRHEDFADFSDAFRAFLLIDSRNPFFRISHPTHRYTFFPLPWLRLLCPGPLAKQVFEDLLSYPIALVSLCAWCSDNTHYPFPSPNEVYIAHLEGYVKQMRTPTGYTMHCNFERWLRNVRL